MLVLTRYPQESIVIGEDVEVTVMEVSGNTVRLRISSPRLSPPVREETLRLENRVQIDDQVQVQVVMLRPAGGRVRLGVNAPPDVAIAREEIKGMFSRNRLNP